MRGATRPKLRQSGKYSPRVALISPIPVAAVWSGKTTPSYYCRITTRGADLGDGAIDPAAVLFEVGLYAANGTWLTENDLTVRGAEAAADWCDKALGAKAAA
jgi:hypothetical protein